MGKTIAENRKARHNYFIEDTLEGGLVLTGTEVKSLRSGRANIAESYASPEQDELWLINAHIAEYKQGNRNNHEPTRRRKILLKRREIDRLSAARGQQGLTLIPLKLYFNDRGFVKLQIGLAKARRTMTKDKPRKTATGSARNSG